MIKKVVIIGCGFAGFAAAKFLCRFKRDAQVTLLDSKETFDFLPSLPDCLGEKISPDFLAYPIKSLSKRLGFNFINQEVKAIDIENDSVSTGQQVLAYDYLIIASGSQTNFYGNEGARKYSFKLDSVADARRILQALKEKDFDAFVISGGGYTGVEVAGNLRLFLRKKAAEKEIIIVERSPVILGPLPDWMKAYVNHNLKGLRIDILTNTVVDKLEENRIFLSNGRTLHNAMLIWVAGVRTADCVYNLDTEKNPQGRIKVDVYLRLKKNCFVAGDAAYFAGKNAFLRMAVQFAIYEGIAAAKNIIGDIKGKALKRYRPVDLGYIIPMANNKSCGSICQVNVTGLLATALHYLMCIYRSIGLKNKFGIIMGIN